MFLLKLPFLTYKRSVKALNIVSAYACSAIVLIISLTIFNNNQELVNPTIITNFILVVALTSGFELGLVKSSLINSYGPKQQNFDLYLLFKKTSVKALIPSIFISILWISFGGSLSIVSKIIFSYSMCLIGVFTAELRVVFNHIKSYSIAAWVKQAGMTIGILAFLIGIYFGFGQFLSLFLYCLTRAVWLALVSYKYKKISSGKKLVKFDKNEHLGWESIFSLNLLAIISGNADRIIASYFLESSALIGYFLIYEIVTKYWIIVYITNPIIFVRSADSTKSNANMPIFIKITSILAVFSICFFIYFLYQFPLFFNNFFNIQIKNLFISIFFSAIVLNSITQVISTILISRGYAKSLLKINTTVAMTMGIISILAIINYGVNGLITAWLLKSIFEGVLVGSVILRRKNEFY